MTCPAALCRRFNRPRPIAWLFFIAGFGMMLALGCWQLERLQWKRDLIARIEESHTKAPVTALPEDADAVKALEFHYAELTGRYDPKVEFHITPRYLKSELGYHIFTPFVMEDGNTVLVNRGWVPAAQKERDKRPGSDAPKGKVTVSGMLRLSADRNRFTPPNNPKDNLWFGRDVTAMAEHAGLAHVVPVSLDIIGEQHMDQLPVPSDGAVNLLNDHLQYAITWFAIALGILVIFLVYHHKGKEEA